MKSLTFALAVLACLWVATPAHADLPDWRAIANEHLAEADALAEKIKAHPNGGEYTDNIEYLRAALKAVYNAKVAADAADDAAITRAVNADLTQLVPLGYLAHWPGNPFVDWKPMPVVTPSDPFRQGAIVLQLCPPEDYSNKGGELLPLSFALSIYGMHEVYTGGTEAYILHHMPWVTIPQWAVFTMTSFTSSAEDAKAARIRRDAAKAQQ
jgi:hypothetical protein